MSSRATVSPLRTQPRSRSPTAYSRWSPALCPSVERWLMVDVDDADDPYEPYEKVIAAYPRKSKVLVEAGKRYPRMLVTTSTRDDRVHPGHARKLMALMEAQGHDVRYYENIEGGHGGAADNSQRAHMQALAFTFLRQVLFAGRR